MKLCLVKSILTFPARISSPGTQSRSRSSSESRPATFYSKYWRNLGDDKTTLVLSMLPHYPLYIGRQSPSPQSQFSSPPTPRRSPSHQIYLCCLIFSSFIIALLLTVGSSQLHVVSGGGKVLAHATSVSAWLRLAADTNT